MHLLWFEDMHHNLLQLDSILYKFFGTSKFSVIMRSQTIFSVNNKRSVYEISQS